MIVDYFDETGTVKNAVRNCWKNTLKTVASSEVKIFFKFQQVILNSKEI